MSVPIVPSSDLQSLIAATATEFPFKVELSLGPLIDFWTKEMPRAHPVKGVLARMVEEELRTAPELREPIEDLSVVARHQQLVDVLMAVVFAPTFWEQEYGAAMIPFHLRAFFASPSFERMFKGEDGFLRARVNADLMTVATVRLRYAYAVVLRRVYGVEVEVDVPVVFTVTDPETGLHRHFKTHFDSRFVDAVPVGAVPPHLDRERLPAHLADLQALMALLPPDRFVLRGFTVLRAVEVTDQEVLSSLKRDLIDKESIISTARFQGLQEKLRTLFRRPKLHEVLPLFSMAVQRSMEELNARIQTQIKEKFTAIHPVVEWRFRKAVLDSLDRHGDGGGLELEPIVFEKVYPLYALSDIRGSSTQRALAIRHDLLAQLQLAKDVVQAAHQARGLPVLDELLYRIDKHVVQIETGLASGGEVGVISFLRSDVERLFDRLQEFGPGVRARIEAYRAAVDPRLRSVYRQRRVFEESVTRLTETISSYLDLEEQAAQGMFPHYFEKQKTDGVDHQIYIGAALVEDGRFDPLYLKNLRLWQLMVVCGIAARADQLTKNLPVPLQTTHLILVQHAPLSIRFRFDEKRFDVDGAYDIRYEIVKKRIDKAVVKGATERVTQPGKIAIVYAQPGEALEYRGYIEYLQHLGYLSGEVEDLELEEFQGVHGLRALRVTVALRGPQTERPLAASAFPAASAVAR